MVSKNILNELHTLGYFVLFAGIFVMVIPYIFRVSNFNHILFFTIFGIILIKLAIIFREHLRFDKII